MDWIISSQNEGTGRVSETRYTTEASFRAAFEDMFSDIRRRFLSAGCRTEGFSMKTRRASWSGRPADQAGSDGAAPPVRLGNRRVNVDRDRRRSPIGDSYRP